METSTSGRATKGPVVIDRLDAFLFRVPLDTPRINSFGKMTHRTALVVRLTDKDGCEGWGECFSNWPAFGAEHRFRILTEILAPKVAGMSLLSPESLFKELSESVRILRIQADEPGPFDQSIAAVDIAAWDLCARRENLPLYQLLGNGEPAKSIPCYASGLSPDQALKIASNELEKGTRAFKCKIGFGEKEDIETLTELRDLLGPDIDLMADVNQKWSMETARHVIPLLQSFDLKWVEEPVSADHPTECFVELSNLGVPIAGGENVRGYSAFSDMIHQQGVHVLQPDIIKWGGITGCLEVARSALDHGMRYCPHYLGGGIGLMATAHLLAAAGGDGQLELDATPNKLREMLAAPYPQLQDGQFVLPQSAGIGVTPDLHALAPYQSVI